MACVVFHNITYLMKGTEVPNPRRISACDCTCVLTRLSRHSLMLAMRILFCSCLCKVRSRVSDALSQALCNLSVAFLADFTLSDSTALIRFIAFSRKLHSAFPLDRKTMITAFTCLPSYRHSSFTLRACFCWRHTYCQWPIIELAMNVSPTNKTAASHVVEIHTHARSKKWPTYHVAVCHTNRKRSSFATKHFQRESLKIFDLHPPPRRLVSFVE